jgi:mannose-1-phosphate guanylyltransferase
MVIVIIAGGSGTRLWPLSQGDHPKHLLSLTNDHSMLQNTYHRAKQSTSDIYVVTEISHSKEVRHQLPELDDEHIVVEPGRRGTASCIVLALARASKTHGEDEPIIFMHADHHIADEKSFSAAVRTAAAVASAQRAIALVGVSPTYPATGLGYIECGPQLGTEEGLPFYAVAAFKEKPTIDVARQYFDSGKHLWNQGLFAAPLKVWAKELKDFAPEYFQAYLDLAAATGDLPLLTKTYLNLENRAIDYALFEHKPHLVVVPALYDWADIGAFVDLHEILKGSDGNTLQGDVSMINCEDSMIHASDKPIIAIGLSGIIVVDTPEGLLVCAKEQSQLVGELSKKLQARKVTSK